jgi:hypothetical protein
MNRRSLLAAGSYALALATRIAGAHHSFAAFDRERSVVLTGTVREFQWTNPHAWIQLLVPEADGGQQEWSIECGSPNMMARQGWKSGMLQVGDKVALMMHPMQDGSPVGSLVSITLADGRVLGPGGAPAPQTGNAPAPAGTADFSGVWMGIGNNPDVPHRNTSFPFPPPFTPRGRELSAYWADPSNNLGARCLPGGGPAGQMSASTFFPIEFIQRPEQVTILFEAMQQVRRIFLDGRGHPDANDLEKSWMGHSIGRWEGDLLVVDTIGVNAGALNGSGVAVIAQSGDRDPRMPYTEALHLTERMRLLDAGQILEVEQTIDDPIAYTEPFTITRYWKRSPGTPMVEYICTENPRPEDDGDDHLP